MSKQNISISNRTDMREYVNKRDNSRQAQKKKKICEASKKIEKNSEKSKRRIYSRQIQLTKKSGGSNKKHSKSINSVR